MGRGMRAHKKPRKQGGKAMAEQMQKDYGDRKSVV